MHAGARDPATPGGGEAARARAIDHLTAARLHLPASARLHLPVAARLHHPSAAAPRPPDRRAPRSPTAGTPPPPTGRHGPPSSAAGDLPPPRAGLLGPTAPPPPLSQRVAPHLHLLRLTVPPPSVTSSTQLQAQLAADHAVFLKELVSKETSTPPHSPTASAISVRPLLPSQPVSRAVQHRPYTRFKDIVERSKADVKVGIFLVSIPVWSWLF